MRVTRTSGNPIEPDDVNSYYEEVKAEFDRITAELGEFQKLDEKGRAEFQKQFTAAKKAVFDKYPVEAEWDMKMFSSKAKIKKLINQYGPIVFGRDSDTKQLAVFILDTGV